MNRILLFALLFFVERINAQLCFGSTTNYTVPPTATSPSYLCKADFNMDSKMDIVVSTRNSIDILLGTGAGTFGGATSVGSTAVNYAQIVSEDFNGDGKPDLAFASFPNQVAIKLGTGTGTFGANTTFTIGASGGSSSAYGINTADVNGDFKPDLLVVDQGTNNICVLLNNGTGSFSSSTSFSVGNTPGSVIGDDFNNDGKLDLAVTNMNSNDVSILIGDGLGGFGIASNFPVGNNPYSVTSADFNGDGKIDLAVVDTIDVLVFLNSGSGNFGPATHFSVGSIPEWIINSDFNGDSKTDLVVAHNGNNVSVFLSLGDGNFNPAINFGTGADPWSVISTDFNGDGKLDIASANYSSGNVSVLLNCTPTPTCVASVIDSMYNISPLNWEIQANYSSQVTNAVWYWGDGTSTTGLYPSHTYTAAGWYSICATVYTSCGDSAYTCRNDSMYRYTSISSMVNVNVISHTTKVNQLIENNNQLKVFPIPTTNKLTIQSSTDLGLIVIYNSLGEIALQTTSKNIQEQIDISKLPAGMYFVEAKNIRIKLIKN